MEVNTGYKLMGGNADLCRALLPSRPVRFDFSDLRRFASIVERIVDKATIFPDEDVDPICFGDLIGTRLTDMRFKPDRDYVVIAGDSLIATAVSMIIGRHYNGVTFLRWDNQMRGYWPCRIY